MISRKILSTLVGVSLWEIMSITAGTRGFPHIWSVLSDLVVLLTTVSFWNSLGVTVWLSLIGLALGTAIAFLFGFFIGLSSSGDTATRGVLSFVRGIPAVVLLPLLVASVGASAKTAVVLVMIVVSFKLILYVIRGVRDTDPQLLESVAAIGMPLWTKLFLVYLPSTLSIVGTGLRLSASRAFGTIVAAGIVAGTPGIGSQMFLAEASANYERMFSYVVVMGIVGTSFYAVFSAIERKFVVWRVTV